MPKQKPKSFGARTLQVLSTFHKASDLTEATHERNKYDFLHKGGAQQDSAWQHDKQLYFQVSTDIMKEKYLTFEHALRESLAGIRSITEVKEALFKYVSKCAQKASIIVKTIKSQIQDHPSPT